MNGAYLLISSRDPFTHVAAQSCYALAADLAGRGHTVTLFLVQNGVLPARPSDASDALEAVAKQGVTVLADVFSLSERGIDSTTPSVTKATLDTVIDALEAGARVLWH